MFSRAWRKWTRQAETLQIFAAIDAFWWILQGVKCLESSWQDWRSNRENPVILAKHLGKADVFHKPHGSLVKKHLHTWQDREGIQTSWNEEAVSVDKKNWEETMRRNKYKWNWTLGFAQSTAGSIAVWSLPCPWCLPGTCHTNSMMDMGGSTCIYMIHMNIQYADCTESILLMAWSVNPKWLAQALAGDFPWWSWKWHVRGGSEHHTPS